MEIKAHPGKWSESIRNIIDSFLMIFFFEIFFAYRDFHYIGFYLLRTNEIIIDFQCLKCNTQIKIYNLL